MKSTGNRIEAIRKRRGLSRADLADRLEVTRLQVWRMETGKVNVRIVDLPKIAKALRASIAELIA